MEISTIHKEHSRWRAEHSRWLEELKQWKGETAQAITALRRLADRLALIEEGLDDMVQHAMQHDGEILNHERALEQAGDALSVDEQVAAMHARESMTHWRHSVAFDVAKVRHRAIVKMVLHMHETADRMLV